MFQLSLQGPDPGHSLVQLTPKVPNGLLDPACRALKENDTILRIKQRQGAFSYVKMCRLSRCSRMQQLVSIFKVTNSFGQSSSILTTAENMSGN